jgi:ABC-2 type transport system ATP-binding protein
MTVSGEKAIIEAEGLTREFRLRDGKRRRRLTAVDDLTVRIEPGEAVGYIGANGAGKSTTIKMLTGILVPTSGSVVTCGLRPVPDRRRLARQVGVVFGQRSQLWWDLPVRESFRILAAIHSLTTNQERSRTDELVAQLELGEFSSTPVRQLSLGQRMRAEVAAALLHSPRLVILDEPTIGLDVLSKQRLREFLIGERQRHGTTLLLTTHDMGDVERLCDRILVIDHGKLAYDGDLPGLSRTVGAQRVLVVDLAEPMPDLTGIGGARHLGSEAGGLRQRLGFDAEQTTAAKVLTAVSEKTEVLDLTVEEPGIEDVVRRIYAASRLAPVLSGRRGDRGDGGGDVLARPHGGRGAVPDDHRLRAGGGRAAPAAGAGVVAEDDVIAEDAESYPPPQARGDRLVGVGAVRQVDRGLQPGRDSADPRVRDARGQLGDEEFAALAVLRAHPAHVPVIGVRGEELREGQLVERVAGLVEDGPLPQQRLAPPLGDDGPRQPDGGRERLAGGAEVGHDVGGDALQRADRAAVVAELTVVVVLDDQAAGGARPPRHGQAAFRGQGHAERELV